MWYLRYETDLQAAILFLHVATPPTQQGQPLHDETSCGTPGAREMLTSVVEEIRRAVTRDVSGAQLLHTLLRAPWLHGLLKVYDCLLEFKTMDHKPTLPHASGLVYEALLSSHDSVAQSDYEPFLPPLPEELPGDEDAMRIVCLVKNDQPLLVMRRGGLGGGGLLRGRWNSLRRLDLDRFVLDRCTRRLGVSTLTAPDTGCHHTQGHHVKRHQEVGKREVQEEAKEARALDGLMAQVVEKLQRSGVTRRSSLNSSARHQHSPPPPCPLRVSSSTSPSSTSSPSSSSTSSPSSSTSSSGGSYLENHVTGATIKRDEETGEIYIARVIHGGLADRSGLLHPGDLLLEVNGNPVEGLEPEQVIQILVVMRAMVDYSPQQDWSLPCPDVGMCFRKGQLLEVVDQTDGHWWQARKLPVTTSCVGLIPSASMLKSKRREQWWSQPVPIHTCIRPAGFRRSFRLWRRMAYKGCRLSCYSCSPHSTSLSNPYEEVVLYRRSPQENHRLIVLVDTTRPMGEGEQTGREYHFVTKELFEYMVCNHRFLEYGLCRGHLYGTSSDSIRVVLKTGRICIIDAEPHSLPALRSRKLKPYVIFIRPPERGVLRLTRRHARILTSCCTCRPYTEEDYDELEEASGLMEMKYCQLFDQTVESGKLEEATTELLSIIQEAQEEEQWVPVPWSVPEESRGKKKKKKKKKRQPPHPPPVLIS
ncbi:hypothetical protein CRUP_012976 [Coryphaenoides rupestris]|nr:hypothetical protein CRUP_012976 [Coryphaenoides rupestris]